MADSRMVHKSVLVDPTTTTQQAGVDASGHLQVDLAANSAGNLTVDIAAQAVGSVAVEGEAAENAAAAGNPVLTGGRYDSTPRTLGDGDVGALALDADGAVHISDGGNAITVDGTVTANLSATDNTVLDNIDTNTTGLNNCVGTDGGAGPSSTLSMGGTESGGNIQELRVDGDGHLQVDVLTGGGASTPTTPVTVVNATSGVAPAATGDATAGADLNAALELWQVDLGGSVPFRADIKLRQNSVDTTIATIYVMLGSYTWIPPHPDFAGITSSAGNDTFIVTFTNLDADDTTEFTASFHYANA